MKLRNSILIFLIDGSQNYDEGIKTEFGDEREVKVMVFGSFDQCTNYLYRSPDIIVMDDPEDSFVRGRIKMRLDSLTPKVKMIFITPPEQREEDINADLDRDDIIVKDDSLYEKLKIAVEEFTFAKTYHEDYDNDVLTIDNFLGNRGAWFVPGVFVFLSAVIALIVYIS